jgi:hypothetical protein
MAAPIVFISYSHDNEPHKQWVLQLAADLRARGVDALLDQWDLSPGQDVAAFMESSITAADRVLMICTQKYVEKAEKGDGGVGYERLIVTGELVARIDTKKFVPLVRQASEPANIPKFLGSRLYIDFSDDAAYSAKIEELAREIHGTPARTKPPLGPNPYTGTIPPPVPARIAGPSGLTARGDFVLDEQWFVDNISKASSELVRTKRTGAMEIRAALHDPVSKSQLELLNAVRASEIRTFGWPIGVLLENRDEFRPKPMADGIVAEVAISGRGFSGESSYDYWALRNNGDFALLQTLFEDERRPGSLFFDTRIVRITESLLFVSRLYQHLGVVLDARVSVRIGHRGLRGRTITSASQNRHILEATTAEERAEAQITDTVDGIRKRLVEHVQAIAAPIFMLFDFKQFDHSIYKDIVTKFVAGHIS